MNRTVFFRALMSLIVVAALPLVASAQSVGPLKRDAQGRIVPDTTAASGQMSSSPAGTKGRGVYPGQILAPTIEPDRTEFTERARQRQNEVSRILAEEKIAKARGEPVDAQGLTAREQILLADLTREDREVRAHELAHYYTGRPYTSEPEYWFIVGPLSKRFAVSGHVRFDLSPIANDAQATLNKYKILRRAALAPMTPSPYDQRVAADLDRSMVKLKEQISQAE
jgi:flagellar biosynthesis/type III secretory pathway chaperone